MLSMRVRWNAEHTDTHLKDGGALCRHLGGRLLPQGLHQASPVASRFENSLSHLVGGQTNGQKKGVEGIETSFVNTHTLFPTYMAERNERFLTGQSLSAIFATQKYPPRIDGAHRSAPEGRTEQTER